MRRKVNGMLMKKKKSQCEEYSHCDFLSRELSILCYNKIRVQSNKKFTSWKHFFYSLEN